MQVNLYMRIPDAVKKYMSLSYQICTET